MSGSKAWGFRQFISEEGENRMADWVAQLDEAAQGALASTLLLISNIDDWGKHWKPLNREHAGLDELRVKWDVPLTEPPQTRRLRPVGVRQFQQRRFVFFGGAEKFIWGEMKPPDAFDKALILKREFDLGKGTNCEHRTDPHLGTARRK